MLGGIILEKRIKSIIAFQLDVPYETISDDGSLIDDYGADSLDIVEMALALEEEYGIDIPDSAVYSFSTVGDVIRYVKERVKCCMG